MFRNIAYTLAALAISTACSNGHNSGSSVVIPGNAAPTASGVTITGDWQIGKALTGSYTYSDSDNDSEDNSLYQWYLADDSSGMNSAVITGATGTIYAAQAADRGKYLRFEVTPVAKTGTSLGSASASSWGGPVSDPCIVTTDADDGAGSLRQILNNADMNNCAKITFDSAISLVTLTSGQIEVPTGLIATIDGGSPNVTISGNNASRVFYVNSSATVTFDNLIITEGASTDYAGGGGIYNNNATVTVGAGATVTGNTANYGGGIVNAYGTLLVKGVVSSNLAKNNGGGILNDYGGSINVEGTVQGNSASYGGGLSLAYGTHTISGIVTQNTSTSWGGGIYNAYSIVTISGTVSSNTSGSGGGIYNAYGTLNLSGVLSGNRASYGGGIGTYSSAKVDFQAGNIIENNQASTDGGGMYNSLSVTITGTPTGSGNTPNNCAGVSCPGGW